jgi:hypothetical protein
MSNAYWSKWEANVCPQQSGYGFTNCNSAQASTVPNPGITDFGQQLKEDYRKRALMN